MSKRLHPVWGEKHRAYMSRAKKATIAVAEGAVRAGKTIDNVAVFAWHIEHGTPDRIHLATGSTAANAKLNLGDCNGFGLEHIFRGRCHWTKYKGNDALAIKSHGREYIVIFAGGGKADSYKKIRGNSYGMWIATEINLHHEDTIKEAFNRQLAAKNRHIYWDMNPSAPNAWIYSEYVDRLDELFGDGACYEHFTIRDNATITPERLAEIERQYTPGSVWRKRDIDGLRCNAEGLIYRNFADAVVGGINPYMIEENPNFERLTRFDKVVVGVDFGGNGSKHAFVATGFHGRTVVAMLSERPEPGSVTQLEDGFISFVRKTREICKRLDYVCADSAEQVLIAQLRIALQKAGIDVPIFNAKKIEINDRIRLTDMLMSTGRFFYASGANTVRDALSSCVWSGKHPGIDERLDDGTTDIDTCDAFEYTIERDYRSLIG